MDLYCDDSYYGSLSSVVLYLSLTFQTPSKALKFVCDEMPRAFKSYKDNYNVVFLDIIQACSSNILSMKLSGFKPTSPRYRYEYLQQVDQDIKNKR